jgi:hypothetical protein
VTPVSLLLLVLLHLLNLLLPLLQATGWTQIAYG